MATKKWIPIVVGIVIFVILVGAGLVGSFAYMLSKQVKVQEMTVGAGEEEFDRLVAGMAGQTPFIEMPAGDAEKTVVHRELATKDTGSVSKLCLRIWSPRDRHLVRVDLPFWLVRLTGHNSIRFDAGSHGLVKLRVTPEDIDRRGPGLILNTILSDGERLLVWTE
jgi:hypothetical protein